MGSAGVNARKDIPSARVPASILHLIQPTVGDAVSGAPVRIPVREVNAVLSPHANPVSLPVQALVWISSPTLPTAVGAG